MEENNDSTNDTPEKGRVIRAAIIARRRFVDVATVVMSQEATDHAIVEQMQIKRNG